MNLFRAGLSATIIVALAPFLHAESNFGRQWMDNYYRSPQPANLVTAAYSLSQSGYFSSPAHVGAAIGFFTTIFEQNPASVSHWLRDSAEVLPEHDHRILAAAAWLAANPAARGSLQSLSEHGNNVGRFAAAEMLARSPGTVVADIPLDSITAVNLQWGAFLASGEKRYIDNVFLAFGSTQSSLPTSARYAMVQEASQNPRLLEICRENLGRQAPAVRASFEAALNEISTPQKGV